MVKVIFKTIEMDLKYFFRYESTITAQFFGHTHYDEYELFYDTQDLGRANNIAFIGPSVTPYYDLNPGYRIYYVDGDHDKSTRVKYLYKYYSYILSKYQFGNSHF